MQFENVEVIQARDDGKDDSDNSSNPSEELVRRHRLTGGTRPARFAGNILDRHSLGDPGWVEVVTY